MNKDIEVRFDKEAYNEYVNLQEFILKGKLSKKNPSYEQLLSSINTAIRNLKINPHYGNLIPRKNISKAVYQRYGTDKILRVELIGYWR